jgi:hypothetical protein
MALPWLLSLLKDQSACVKNCQERGAPGVSRVTGDERTGEIIAARLDASASGFF